MTAPSHVDRGGGYCDCGAQLCSFPECDGWCKHPGGWVEKAELEVRRWKFVEAQAKAVTPLPPLRQSWPTVGRAYCGCCRQEHPAHEVQSGTCMDCLDGCWSSDCVRSSPSKPAVEL